MTETKKLTEASLSDHEIQAKLNALTAILRKFAKGQPQGGADRACRLSANATSETIPVAAE